MEPKYYAFRRWLDTPCSSAENMSGFLARGGVVKIIQKVMGTCRVSLRVTTVQTQRLRLLAQDTVGMSPGEIMAGKNQNKTQDVVITLW